MPVEMNFRETGSGPVLVILHGLFGSSDNWMSISRKLEDHFHIYLPDLRNHGQSPHTNTHTYEDMTKDLEFFFADHHIGKAYLLGHSMGGKVAMMFSALFPEKIAHLVVADIAPKSYRVEDEEEDKEMLLTLMEQIDFGTFSSRREIDEFLEKKIKSISLRQFLLKNIYRDTTGNFSWKMNVPVLKKFLPEILTNVNQEFFSQLEPQTHYPVTFIRGLNSNYINDEDLPLIHKVYPQADIIDIPEAGHWLHAQEPEKFSEAMLKLSSKNLG